MKDTRTSLEKLTPQLHFELADGKIWLNEQRIMLFSRAALGKFRREVYDTIGLDRARAFFLRLGFQLGKLDGELARNSSDHETIEERFGIGPQLHALRGMVLPELKVLKISETDDHFRCEVEWFNSYEVEICKTELPGLTEPGCWTLEGYATGYSSQFTQRRILFREMECQSCGDDRCFAIGKPLDEWGDTAHIEASYARDALMQELTNLQAKVEELSAGVEYRDALAHVVGVSKPFKAALQMVTKASDSRVSVLLLGETGVGKEVMARALHSSSDRADKPFIAVNCAAIPTDLIEAELFGVAKGAYTGAIQSRAGKFERADGGTIFLDEVIELSPRAQATLLRVLQEREFERLGDNTVRRVDVRVVAATNEDLGDAVNEGRFRADLYYRLSAYPVRIPPLRERREDISLFVKHFLEKHLSHHNKHVDGISDRGMELLQRYEWPGNIRELENVIERAVILAEPNGKINLDLILGPSLKMSDSELSLARDGSLVRTDEQGTISGIEDIANFVITQKVPLEKIEEVILNRALDLGDGKISKAARLLGMTRPAFAYRIKKLQDSEAQTPSD